MGDANLQDPSTIERREWPSTIPPGHPELRPPPHSRPLYASIPLPRVDAADQWEAHLANHVPAASRGLWGRSHPTLSLMPTSNLWQPPFPNQAQTIKLHPILEAVYLAARQIPSEVSHAASSSPSLPTGWAQCYHEPATTPAVRSLTTQVHSTGEIAIIRPSSFASPYIVTVGDVLATLECLFIIRYRECHERCRSTNQAWSCGCDRLTLTMNSLQLWWVIDEQSPENLRPWRLVVGRR